MSDLIKRLGRPGYDLQKEQAIQEAIIGIRELHAKIESMEKQKPVRHEFQGRDGRWHPFIDQRHYENTVADGSWPIRALYLAPGAQPAPSHALDDNATIAGLESAVTHLSVLLDSFQALLVEVNDVCGRDGHGGPLEEGESEIIDKVRAAISMTEAPPCAKGEEK